MLLSAPPARSAAAAAAAAAAVGTSKGNHVSVEVLEEVSVWLVGLARDFVFYTRCACHSHHEPTVLCGGALFCVVLAE
jgi:hypothetical protein